MNESFRPPYLIEDYREADGTTRGPHLARIGLTFNREGSTSRNRRTYRNVAGWVGAAQSEVAVGGLIPMYTSHEAALRDQTMQTCGRLTRVFMEGADARAEGLIPDTPTGRDVLTLIAGGYVSHVSQRLGEPLTVERLKAENSPDGKDGWEVVSGGRLRGIDITNSPGIDRTAVARIEAGGDPMVVESFQVNEYAGMDGCCGTCEADGPCSDDGPCTCPADCQCRTAQGDDAQSAYDPPYWERDFTADKRKAAADAGAALPDGSFPIYTQKDLDNAAGLAGHANDPAAARAYIRKRAKALGLSLPDSWKDGESSPSADLSEGNADMKTRPGTNTLPPQTEMASDIAEALAAAGTPPTVVTDPDPQGPIAESVVDALNEATPNKAPADEIKDARTGPVQQRRSDMITTTIKHVPKPEADPRLAALEEQIRQLRAEMVPGTNDVTESAETIPLVDACTDSVTALDAHVTEAGRVLSAASKAKIQGAHDVLATMNQLPCAADGDDSQSAATQTIDEAAVKTLVAEAVEAALLTEREAADQRIESVKAEQKRLIDEMMTARRKTKAVTESDLSAEAEIDKMSIGEMLAATLRAQGHISP